MIGVIDSDKGSYFTSKVLRSVITALGIQWEYHTPWHPQSYERVERMNQTLKHQLSKLMIETKLSWIKCLPLALLNIRTMPNSITGISPFEMLYGMPYTQGLPIDHPKLEDRYYPKLYHHFESEYARTQGQRNASTKHPLGIFNT